MGIRKFLTIAGINVLRRLLPPEMVEIRLKSKEHLQGPVRILGINASLRGGEGFSAKMLIDFLEQARGFGAETEIITLSEKNIRHCEGCISKDNSECISLCVHQDDDTKIVLEKIIGADAYVFASPTYWGGISSYFQLLLEKMTPLEDNRHELCLERYGREPLFGKAAVILNSQDGEGAEMVFGRLSVALSHLGVWMLPDAMISQPTILNRRITRIGMRLLNERKFEWIPCSISKAARNLVLVTDLLRVHQWDDYRIIEPPC